MDTVRIGLIGAGFMGKIHTIAYRNAALLFGSDIPPIEQTVVTDFEPALAEHAVRHWGWAHAVPLWQEVTGDDDVDLVDICTPNDAHVDIALDALSRGKHVLCEKAAGPHRGRCPPAGAGGAGSLTASPRSGSSIASGRRWRWHDASSTKA